MPTKAPELPKHKFGWNESTGRYRDLTTGRFLSEKIVTSEIDKLVLSSSETMRGITRQLVDGNLSLPEWQGQMMREIKAINRITGEIARGGYNQMSPSDWGKIGAETKRQYKYLQKFAAEIASGKQPLDGRCLTRAELYGKAGRGTYHEMKRKGAARKGKGEERRVLGAAEHCTSSGGLDGCVEIAGLGWQPAGTLPRIGESPCRTHCKCTFEFR